MNRCFVLLAALLLSACVGGAGNSVPSVTYDFGLPVARRGLLVGRLRFGDRSRPERRHDGDGARKAKP